MVHNPELELAYNFVQYTNRNIFLTGKAGTGKTTFLHKLRKETHKRMVVVAPTGVAAINAKGVTIHSFFQMSFGPQIPGTENHSAAKKFNREKINIIKSLDLLVIDEISMVRADMLDGIDAVLRRYKNPNLPFGGVQLLMIGDLQQLAPIVKPDEWRILQSYYDTIYFFSSKAFQQSQGVSIELKHIYRQAHGLFINILNEIREDRLSEASMLELNKRYIPDFSPENDDGYITLTTHNANAQRINEAELKKVKTKQFKSKAKVNNLFPEYSYPTEFDLELKIGAQVMFVKNDSAPEKRFYNGKIGTIADIDDGYIYVQCKGDDEPIEVDKEKWENLKFSINDDTKEIEEEVIGSFVQYPLRLAWAITIHKSQGLTFEKAIIDASAAFAHGQTYVALSRCKTLEGVVLSSKISEKGIICDQTVNSFNKNIEENAPDEQVLNRSKLNYQLSLLDELFNYRQIQYYIKRCQNILYENASIVQGNLNEVLVEIQNNGIAPFLPVSAKFLQQLQELMASEGDMEESSVIQDRIKKACAYFLDKSKRQVSELLLKASFETDNKAVGKSIDEIMLKLRELIAVKEYCFKACDRGFVVKDYLGARAKAVLQKYSRSFKEKSGRKEVTTKHPELYNQLLNWRRETADKDDLSLAQVASLKVLASIANTLPANKMLLKNIKGVGPKKVEKYGRPILEMVQEYCKAENIETASNELLLEIPVKKDTKQISFELFQEGLNRKQIAEKRGMVLTTIEGHLAHYVSTGELKIQDFVSDKNIKLISDYIKKNKFEKLNKVKEALPREISYSDIRFVLGYLQYQRDAGIKVLDKLGFA